MPRVVTQKGLEALQQTGHAYWLWYQLIVMNSARHYASPFPYTPRLPPLVEEQLLVFHYYQSPPQLHGPLLAYDSHP